MVHVQHNPYIRAQEKWQKIQGPKDQGACSGLDMTEMLHINTTVFKCYLHNPNTSPHTTQIGEISQASSPCYKKQLIFGTNKADTKLVSSTLTYFWSELFLPRYSGELLAWHRRSIYLLPRECANLHQVCSRHYKHSLEPSSSLPTRPPPLTLPLV